MQTLSTMRIPLIAICLSVLFTTGCEAQPNDKSAASEKKTETPKVTPIPVAEVKYDTYEEFDRTEIIKALQQKIDDKQPLVVHAFVPLCDNENQGIVPTTPSLGNGMSLNTNLYWYTSKGMKKYFMRHSQWKMLNSQLDVNEHILERVIFERKYSNGAKVYLVADAYRGDRMKECMETYFSALAGRTKDTITINNQSLPVFGNADLLSFNGHDGLMDMNLDYTYNKDKRKRDAVVISCYSEVFFNQHLKYTQSYPLVMTTHLLYPGANILGEVINSWATLKTDNEIRLSAGDEYYNMKPKCGRQGARNLFSTGW
jgi:hypothetical protein